MLMPVIVILVASRRLRAAEAEWVDPVGAVGGVVAAGVIGQQDSVGYAPDQGPQSIHRRRVVACPEDGFSWQVQRNRIGREIMIERDVFLENDDQMHDR